MSILPVLLCNLLESIESILKLENLTEREHIQASSAWPLGVCPGNWELGTGNWE